MSVKLPGGLGRFDFSQWFVGLISSFISGGAGAFITGTGLTMSDPKYFGSHPSVIMRAYLIAFFSTGFLAMMNFLHQHPVPSTITTYQKVKETSDGVTTTNIKVEEPSPIDSTVKTEK